MLKVIKALLAAMVALPALAQPPFDCSGAAAHRAFDFWLGQWQVRDAAGELQGHNSIIDISGGM